MKADLIAEEVFTVQVGAVKIERVRVASRWNGMMELRTPSGETLIVSAPARGHADAFSTIFGDVLRTADETKDAGTIIIAGTPSLLARLRAGEALTHKG